MVTWQRGFLRLWVAFSVVWIVGAVAIALKDTAIPSLTKDCNPSLEFRLEKTGEPLGPAEIAECQSRWREERKELAAWSLAPPIGLFLTLSWIARGFRPRK